jgi:hypothetical protein
MGVALRSWKSHWILWLLFAAVCAGFSATPLVNAFQGGAKDWPLWYHTGRLVLEQKEIYPTGPGQWFEFIYPPFSAIFVFAPLSILPMPWFVGILCLANSAAWLLCVLLCVRLVTGRWTGQPMALYVLPALLSAPYVYDTFLLGQPNLVLLAFMLLAFLALRERRPWTAGAMIALATAIKAFPLLAVGYLLWRRRFAAAAATVLFLLAFVVVLPGAVRGLGRTLDETGRWADAMVLHPSGQQLGQRGARGFTYFNQSLNALTHRLLRPVDAGVRGADEHPFRVNVADIPPWAAQLVFAAVAALLCAVFVWSLPRGIAHPPLRSAVEEGMLLCLIVMFSPLAWTYFYCWLMLPGAAAVGFVVRQPRGSPLRPKAVALCVASVLILASALTQHIDQFLQAVGATTVGTIMLFLTLAWMQRKMGVTDEKKRSEKNEARTVLPR